MSVRSVDPLSGDVAIGPLEKEHLDAADQVMRVAFGTFLGLPDPTRFAGDASYVRPRWEADPTSAFAATADGAFAGSNFTTRWGSVGFFGPLTVRPDHWDRGLGARLVEAAMARFEDWGVRHAGLYTFADSAKHQGLYRRFGFRPRFLTAILAKPAAAGAADFIRYSTLDDADRSAFLDEARAVSDAIYEGLDLAEEIEAVRRLG
ncbi:MAG: GNAT family N-acetyltransferase, partial [Myxococcales bacterium]|nr:GNAT family N-acetyltransferase [Myxococcales bacterium]